MHIKICGLTRLEDALTAVDARADMLGYNFYASSPRFIDPSDCARIQGKLANRGVAAVAVGVFVNASAEAILRIMDECGLQLAQLHGDEPPALLEALGHRAFKAIRPRSRAEAGAQAASYPLRSAPPAYLVDAHQPQSYGGTGLTGDWDIAQALAAEYPLLLAGGLRIENVRDAIRAVRPWGIDVASGVESSPGVKDPQRMADLIRTVHSLSEEVAT